MVEFLLHLIITDPVVLNDLFLTNVLLTLKKEFNINEFLSESGYICML